MSIHHTGPNTNEGACKYCGEVVWSNYRDNHAHCEDAAEAERERVLVFLHKWPLMQFSNVETGEIEAAIRRGEHR